MARIVDWSNRDEVRDKTEKRSASKLTDILIYLFCFDEAFRRKCICYYYSDACGSSSLKP